MDRYDPQTLGFHPTMSELERANDLAGRYFFQPATLRFFRSRVCADTFPGKTGVYFVTSEKRTGFSCPDGRRLYTVRRFDRTTADVKTVGEFQGYRSRNGALSAAKRAASTEG